MFRGNAEDWKIVPQGEGGLTRCALRCAPAGKEKYVEGTRALEHCEVILLPEVEGLGELSGLSKLMAVDDRGVSPDLPTE